MVLQVLLGELGGVTVVRVYYMHHISCCRYSLSRRIVKEMMWYQNTTKLLIPRLPFCRLVKELIAKYDPTYRIQSEALEALQEATEAFTVHYLSDSNLCTAHAKRKTLLPSDLRLVKELKHVYLFMAVDS